jgi:hypothetical protein
MTPGPRLRVAIAGADEWIGTLVSGGATAPGGQVCVRLRANQSVGPTGDADKYVAPSASLTF